MWAGAGQVDSTLTAQARGADGGGRTRGDAAAALETRLTARHFVRKEDILQSCSLSLLYGAVSGNTASFHHKVSLLFV